MECEPFMGDHDVEVASRWFRKIEKTLIQIKVPDELKVDSTSQLLIDRAQSWQETLQSRKTTCLQTWGDFRVEFEIQFYSWYHCKMKEHKFFVLRQGDMFVLDYGMRFNDLSIFALYHVLTEKHMIEKCKDKLRQELNQGLIALQFRIMRDLTKVAQPLEVYIIKGQEDQSSGGKRKKMEYSMSKPLRPPLFKKRKSLQYGQIQKK